MRPEAALKVRGIEEMLSIPSYRTPIHSFFEREAIFPTQIKGGRSRIKCGMTYFLDSLRATTKL